MFTGERGAAGAARGRTGRECSQTGEISKSTYFPSDNLAVVVVGLGSAVSRRGAQLEAAFRAGLAIYLYSLL
jgi:hypothetical protein